MQKIIPHLWFDKEAVEAAQFYTTVFPGATVKHTSQLHNTPSGSVDIVSMSIFDHEFMFISAGPLFKINPSISFLISCATTDEVDALWNKLLDGGKVMMPLEKYPWSERYGWIADKYGVSWQIMVTNQPITQRIIPSIMFVGDVAGKAEEAITFYTSVFKNSSLDFVARYEANESPNDKEGTIKHASFMLEGQKFTAMDSAYKHEFAFNEAISLIVRCETQEEIDYYWDKLSAVPESEQCGWLKDRYGLSWQITPTAMDEMMRTGTPEQIARVTEAFLKMKKFDIATLKNAFNA